MKETVNGQAVRFDATQIEMAHGAGGKATRRLIEGLIVPLLSNPILNRLEDSAEVDVGGRRIAMTTDGFVVNPLQFPGGSIGHLAVNGTVNDLSVGGAEPVALLLSMIVEAGLPVETLQAEVTAIAKAAAEAGVEIVGGDTKVVEHGSADSLFITTAGVGVIDERLRLDKRDIRPGDQIILSGPIGDHGITILLARGELDIEADLESDTRSVYPLVKSIIRSAASGIRWMRDPTRGGIASALNELARDIRMGAVIYEEKIPLRPAVRGACEILGLDPLHIANEGQFLVVASPQAASPALEAMQNTEGGSEAVIIGEIREEPRGAVLSESSYGGARIVDMLVGDPLPRIC